MKEEKRLSAARRRAVRAMVSSATLEEAAAQARVRPDTLWRWLGNDDDFQRAVEQERTKQRQAACMAAESLLVTAAETLQKVLDDPAADAATQIEATRATLEMAVQLYKLTVLEKRVIALEGRPHPQRQLGLARAAERRA